MRIIRASSILCSNRTERRKSFMPDSASCAEGFFVSQEGELTQSMTFFHESVVLIPIKNGNLLGTFFHVQNAHPLT